jgi:hypothetical protein
MECGPCLNKTRWDEFVRGSPQGNIFCESRFLDGLGDEYELVVIEEGGKIALGAVLMLRSGLVLKAPYPLTMYQGMLCCAESRQMPYHKRCSWLLERVEVITSAMVSRYGYISLCLSHHFEDIRGFQWFHYHEPHLGRFIVDVGYTGILRLDSIADFSAFLSSIRTVRRQEYRRGPELGLSVELSTDVELLNRLHAATFARQGITRSAHEEELLRGISSAALNAGFGELLVCRDKEGRPVSATLFLHDQRYAYYYIGASDPEFRKTGAGVFLVIENIRRALEKGLTAVDFLGINSPNRGDFKTSFNARPVPYYILDYAPGDRRGPD